MMEKQIDIALVGAAGLAGEALLARIADHDWLSGSVRLLGGEASAGHEVEFGRRTLRIEEHAGFDFSSTPLVISSGDDQEDDSWLDAARDAGCIILDVGGRLLPDSDLPPVVAGVNDGLLEQFAHGGIVTLPDAITTQAATLLKPIDQSLELVDLSLFCALAVSELGRSGVEEMARQTARMLNGKPVEPLLFDSQVAFNLLPGVGDIQADGLTGVESRTVRQLRAILDRPGLPVSIICSWAPVFFGHSIALHATVSSATDLPALSALLESGKGIPVKVDSGRMPSAVGQASGQEEIFVGRIVAGQGSASRLSLWSVADNQRSTIAGNLVKIIEVLVKNYL